MRTRGGKAAPPFVIRRLCRFLSSRPPKLGPLRRTDLFKVTASLSLSYDPPGETLKAFRQSKAMARALIGPLHGGREKCAVHDILLGAVAAPQRRFRWLAVRRDMADLEDPTIKVWHNAVPAEIGKWDPQALTHRIEFDFKGRPKDIEIQFLALGRSEHRSRFLNAKATGIWFDGADEIEESAFERALQIAGTWPQDEPPFPSILMTSLMPSEDHWLATRKDLTLFRQPGARTPYAENLKGRYASGEVDPGEYQRLTKLRRDDWIRHKIDAEWAESRAKRGFIQAVLDSYELAA